jgi:hypothetical protein
MGKSDEMSALLQMPRLAMPSRAMSARVCAALACAVVCAYAVALPFTDAARAQAPAAQPAPPAVQPAPPAAAAPATPPAGQPTAPASEEPKPADAAKAKATAGTPAVVIDGGAADTLLGKPVESADGEDMGRIIDVIVDRNGSTRAAIIDFGGFLGVGSRKIAVDWKALRFPIAEDRKRVVLEMTRDQVRAAPEYQEGKPIFVLSAAGRGPVLVTTGSAGR